VQTARASGGSSRFPRTSRMVETMERNLFHHFSLTTSISIGTRLDNKHFHRNSSDWSIVSISTSRLFVGDVDMWRFIDSATLFGIGSAQQVGRLRTLLPYLLLLAPCSSLPYQVYHTHIALAFSDWLTLPCTTQIDCLSFVRCSGTK